LAIYVDVLGAEQGALVYMTSLRLNGSIRGEAEHDYRHCLLPQMCENAVLRHTV